MPLDNETMSEAASEAGKSSLALAIIGNCTISALVDRQARIVWSCFPRFDGDAIFNRLVNNGPNADEASEFSIEVQDFVSAEQQYEENTAVLCTTLTDKHGQSAEIVDFCPRFPMYDRLHRPASIFRVVRPKTGNPRIRVRLTPAFDYGGARPETTRGSNHLRFVGPTQVLRLTTDAAISFVQEEAWFVLEDTHHFIFGADESLTGSIEDTARKFLRQTRDYWRGFSRYLALPYEWQREVIRAAITLKLHSFEETGAVIAATTTSIPEAPHSARNWDYRFCWLRDAYFVVHALNRLGATKTMEDYLTYITNVVAASQDGYLQPLFSISLNRNLAEREIEHLTGYRGMGPVRVGNAAWQQVQNDSYGAVILAATQAFFDHRLELPGTPRLFEQLEKLGSQAVRLWNTPDAGLWELRTRESVHTFSAVMCWAACDRLAKIGMRLGLADRATDWREKAETIRQGILDSAFDSEQNSFVDSFDGKNLDAALLLLPELGFIDPMDERYLGTVAAVERLLLKGGFVQRYHAADDFGEPEVAFTICTFWYVDALAATGRRDEARDLFERLLASRNHVGLLSEDIDPVDGELWGNFPQTYSMVGLINSALKLSKPWEDAI